MGTTVTAAVSLLGLLLLGDIVEDAHFLSLDVGLLSALASEVYPLSISVALL